MVPIQSNYGATSKYSKTTTGSNYTKFYATFINYNKFVKTCQAFLWNLLKIIPCKNCANYCLHNSEHENFDWDGQKKDFASLAIIVPKNVYITQSSFNKVS